MRNICNENFRFKSFNFDFVICKSKASNSQGECYISKSKLSSLN